MVMEGVNKEEKKGEHHPSWRRWAPPASPHMTSPDASQIQEVAREEGREDERVEDPAKHWWLPQPGRFGGCGEPLLLRHADQKLVARFEQ